MEPLILKAELHAIKIGKEGDSKITFNVPLSCLITSAKMAAMVEKPLEVVVRIDEE